MFERASGSVKAAVSHAAKEALRRADRRVGTDHLLLGLLHEPAIATRLPTNAEQARAAARDLDRAALAALGIDLDTRATAAVPRGANTPLTSGVRAVMAWAFAIAEDEGTRKSEP